MDSVRVEFFQISFLERLLGSGKTRLPIGATVTFSVTLLWYKSFLEGSTGGLRRRPLPDLGDSRRGKSGAGGGGAVLLSNGSFPVWDPITVTTSPPRTADSLAPSPLAGCSERRVNSSFNFLSGCFVFSVREEEHLTDPG